MTHSQRWVIVRVSDSRFHIKYSIQKISLISFISVTNERSHKICKDPHDDGSAVDYSFWSPGSTYHLVLLLQVIYSYFPTLSITESKAFIFTLIFLDALIYHHKLSLYFSWIFMITYPSMHGASSASNLPGLVYISHLQTSLFFVSWC